MDQVKIVHPEAGESTVPVLSVPMWRSSGWEPVSAGDKTLIDDAPPQVSQVANAIGYALGERGVRVTAADAIAAAYRVMDQAPAVTAGGEENKDQPDDPPGDSAGASPGGKQPDKKPGQDETKLSARRRQSSKESE